ncbi:MAG TPA: SpoIIE family protein phosphatase [Bryobacteraceae bacterium]|nr:SpoIIE family protein phosphatase [Bryobacteraceae bacterium]
MPDLSILKQDGQSDTFALESDVVTLGRSRENELCFPEDAGLSRQHLRLQRQGDEWLISDLGSKNGTLVNGERVVETRKLKKGDRINAGHLTITFDRQARNFQHTVVFIDAREDTRPLNLMSTSLALAMPGGRRQPSERDSVSADRVAALIRAGRELATHRPFAELFPLILKLAVESVQAERGVLLTLEGDELVVQASTTEAPFRISAGVRDHVLKEKKSILVNDVLSDAAFKGMQSLVQQQVRLLMAAPLQTNDQVIGLIYVDSPNLIHQFSKDDLNLLTVMANVAAVRIEHARLAEIEQAERILAKDLEQAAVIQRQLLPSKAPSISGLELAGHNAACRTVGGDYYDFLPYPDGRIAIALGDVSGKAMPAAMLMTSLQARVQVLAENPAEPAELMTRLNRLTAANCPRGRFISFFFSVLDPATGELTYSNAGHNPPILMRQDGSHELLSSGGLILGIFGHSRYEKGSCRMERGDLVLLFSDGVTEATNAVGEEYGDDRLLETLRANRHLDATALLTLVTQSVTEFSAGAAPADDVTLVIAKRV